MGKEKTRKRKRPAAKVGGGRGPDTVVLNEDPEKGRSIH